ncbi:MAG: hypothetical protein IJV64_02615 [Oscillospiraceae bacterium]|nr:hypothetical protein [Oscillospiraceae bacterium]
MIPDELREQILAYNRKRMQDEQDLETVLGALNNTQKKALVKKAGVADVFERHDVEVQP